LLKITADRFRNLIHAQPDLATPILFSVGRTLVARIRADNKRVRDLLTMQIAIGE